MVQTCTKCWNACKNMSGPWARFHDFPNMREEIVVFPYWATNGCNSSRPPLTLWMLHGSPWPFDKSTRQLIDMPLNKFIWDSTSVPFEAIPYLVHSQNAGCHHLLPFLGSHLSPNIVQLHQVNTTFFCPGLQPLVHRWIMQDKHQVPQYSWAELKCICKRKFQTKTIQKFT